MIGSEMTLRRWTSVMLANAVIASLTFTSAVLGADPAYVGDFASDVQGWDGDAPQFIASGGPDGSSFMQLNATGGNGPGSRMAAFNNGEELTGDFSDAGITGVEVDLMNFATSTEALEMRLVLFGPSTTSNRWVSNDPVVLANDGSWQTATFPINESSLTSVRGDASFGDMLEGVVRIMLRHDVGTPSAAGDRVVASMGVDNFRFLTSVAPLVGDFDDSGTVDVADINLLLNAIKSGNNDLVFDLSGNRTVDTGDVLELVAGELNTYVGDANLDLEFNSTDLVVLFAAGEYEDGVAMNSTWATGDWNGDAEFDTGDLLFAFQQGGYEVGPRGAVAAAVPEPATTPSLLLALHLCLLFRRIGKKSSTNCSQI